MQLSTRVMVVIAGLVLVAASAPSFAQKFRDKTPLQWSSSMADAQIARRGDAMTWREGSPAKWDYANNVFALAVLRLGQRTGDPKYTKFVETSIGSFVEPDGTIRGYKLADHNLDNINGGKTLLALWKLTGDDRFKIACQTLRKQLDVQPRTSEGGFWHKQIYTHQMWLDGLYMAEPFYAEYAKLFNQPIDFDDIAKQFRLITQHTYDPKTGLLYHGWDESREQIWANKQTGTSANFWGRAMGWYGMALVDTLDYFPADHPARAELIADVQKLCAGIAKYQDAQSGLWYQVVDQGSREGNYLEATASSMFVYTMAKAINRGYIARETYQPVIEKGYAGIVGKLIKLDASGAPTLTQCCSVAGLSKDRDGSFAYYIREPIVNNDMKGVGPFIMAGIEIESLLNPATTRP